MQDAYFAAARETIERYGGVLEKFIGDAVVALFGVPRTRDDDAERAVRAGLALVGAVEQLGATVGLEPRAARPRRRQHRRGARRRGGAGARRRRPATP